MFEKIKLTAKTTVKTSDKAMPKTIAFVQKLTEEGYRISYTALRNAATELGEDNSQQKAPQRGAYLANKLPADLQPSVTRKNGTYHEKAIAKWTVEAPADLGSRPVVTKDSLDAFLSVWLEGTAEASDEASEG